MSLSGEKNGLDLIIDSVPITPDTNFQFGKEAIPDNKRMTNSNEIGGPTNADVYIPTLERFKGKGSGILALSVVKLMTGTSSFLALTEDNRKCSLESYEECQTEGFLQQMEAVCGCLPWSLSPALAYQVRTPPSHTSQATNYCTPAAFSCYTNISTQDFGCRKSCTGLYADVLRTDDTNSQNNYHTKHIIKEYQSYKYEFARNIVFNGDTKLKGNLSETCVIILFIVQKRMCLTNQSSF